MVKLILSLTQSKLLYARTRISGHTAPEALIITFTECCLYTFINMFKYIELSISYHEKSEHEIGSLLLDQKDISNVYQKGSKFMVLYIV